MFAESFAANASRPCLRDARRELTYAEALALGRRIISGLPQVRLFAVLRCSLTVEAVAAYAALMIEGHVPLLLEDSLSEDLFSALLSAWRPDAVIDPLREDAGPGLKAPPTNLHPDLGLLLTTSGSTGSPKLVRLGLAGLAANAGAITRYLDVGPNERALLHLPMSYSYGMSVINSHFVAGASVCLTTKSVMEPGYWSDLAEFEATSIAGVPFHYQAIRRLGEKRLEIASLSTLTQAGGRLDPKLVAYFADWAARTGRRFHIMYGQTEAGPRIAHLPPELAREAPDAIGVPIDGVTVDLVDDDGRPAAPGAPGEMVVRSPAVMMGYALTPADLARGDDLGGVLATGDIAVRGEDGLLRIVGRRSQILKIYGLRINLGEIEERLAATGQEAHCFGDDDKLKVLIPPGADPAATRRAIVDLYSLPARGIEVRAAARGIERSGAGKLSRAAMTAAWELATAG
jgi:acyl-CoA synthetase (AMP-forming)/AMP-acid ligase II